MTSAATEYEPCTCTVACIPQGITDEQTCRLQGRILCGPRDDRAVVRATTAAKGHAFDCVCQDCEPRDEWLFTSEPATPLYISPLPHDVRRMLQALDAYWTCCEGMPRGRYPRGSYTAEDWWGRYEKYRRLVEGQL